METTIKINNLTKKFGEVVAINNVSLTIEPGYISNPAGSFWMRQDNPLALHCWVGRPGWW